MTGGQAAGRRPVRSAIGVGRTRVPLGGFYAGILLLLYLPIVILFVFSFSANTRLSFPLQGFTLDWYADVLADPSLIGAARNSLFAAAAAATAATLLGALVALAVVRFRFRGRSALLGLAVLPLIVPFAVMGVAIFLLVVSVGIPKSLLTVAMGHSVLALPYATLILLARLSGIDPALEEAAMDLGASYPMALRKVVLPLIGTALLSAWLTCFVVSFDEVALAIFLVGGDPTFPVLLYGRLRFGGQLPVLIAMAVLLMLATITLTLLALRFGRTNDADR